MVAGPNVPMINFRNNKPVLLSGAPHTNNDLLYSNGDGATTLCLLSLDSCIDTQIYTIYAYIQTDWHIYGSNMKTNYFSPQKHTQNASMHARQNALLHIYLQMLLGHFLKYRLQIIFHTYLFLSLLNYCFLRSQKIPVNLQLSHFDLHKEGIISYR